MIDFSDANLDDRLLKAFPLGDQAPDPNVRFALVSYLHAFYERYLSPAEDFRRIPSLRDDLLVPRIERAWLDWEDRHVDERDLPRSAECFREWFLEVSHRHEQADFCAFLRERATREQLAILVLFEEQVSRRFDDLIAMAQLGAPELSRMTLARSYWATMGEGTPEGMRSRLFSASAEHMRATLARVMVVPPALGTLDSIEHATLALMYGIQRGLVPRSLGALGLVERSAPARLSAMVEAGQRQGLAVEVIAFRLEYINVNVGRGTNWLEHVLLPLVKSSPDVMREVALGVLTFERAANAYLGEVVRRMRTLDTVASLAADTSRRGVKCATS